MNHPKGPNLVAWIGRTDLNAVTRPDEVGLGPIGQAVDAREFERVDLLSNYSAEEGSTYLAWLRRRTQAHVHMHPVELTSPTAWAEIYEAAAKVVDPLFRRPGAHLVFHLSPGTPAMAAVWVILGKTRYPAELIESSRQHGVKTASIPFEISAELVPDLMRRRDAALQRQSAAPPPAVPEFAAIIHRSEVMARVVARARLVATRSIPVLLEGETGTGKELLARAVHAASPRRVHPFVPVNCGAIPSELVESTLFGHARGSFTGAVADHKGVFEAAHGGTLFLDELGELPLAAQVKLLRTLQEAEVTRIGETAARKVDVRVIAATHRDLLGEVAAGRFREDLFFRLAVAVLRLPPLRDRKGDLGLLIDHLLGQVQHDLADQPGFTARRLTPAARELLLQHSWPGNIRELSNTLLRAALWSDDPVGADAIREALIPAARGQPDAVLGRPLGDGFSLAAVLDEVERHYLSRALAESGNNKTRAARLLGLSNYQTLGNHLARLGM
ncbi:MAG: sigma 54-interacting transcriptional regulator [Dehalococcoidia bacterium]|nr:sigma 54-interacting transcriptional regulator [Dehalococcoidia bacterium]